MRGAFKIISIRGIRLYVHWTFLFLIGWVVLVNARMGNDIIQLSWSVMFILAVFACVALHEFGHALMAARFGIKARNIVLLPIGGIASIEKFPDNPRQELAISLAGPLVNIIIAGLLWLLFLPGTAFWSMPADASIMHGHDFMANLFIANLALAFFNLIPAFPMDGGRVLRALLGFKLNYIQATAIAAAVGRIIAIGFIAMGILLMNPFLPIIGIFIIFSAGTEEYYLRLKALVKDIRLNEVLMYDYQSLQTNSTVHEAADTLMNNHNKYFVLMDGARPVGSIHRLEIVKAMADKNYKEPLKNLVKEELEYLDGNTAVDTVLEKLARNDERIFPVMDNDQFVGVVNLSHIIEYLLLYKPDAQQYERVRSLVGLLH
jgi:Zn-dependent protease/predicted transcriptional regulator